MVITKVERSKTKSVENGRKSVTNDFVSLVRAKRRTRGVLNCCYLSLIGAFEFKLCKKLRVSLWNLDLGLIFCLPVFDLQKRIAREENCWVKPNVLTREDQRGAKLKSCNVVLWIRAAYNKFLMAAGCSCSEGEGAGVRKLRR